MRILGFLFRRWRRVESTPIREGEAYAHSYGERTGEVVSVVRVPEPRPEPEPEVEPEPEPEPGPPSELEPEPSQHRTSGLTDALLRRAFRAKLDARGRATT